MQQWGSSRASSSHGSSSRHQPYHSAGGKSASGKGKAGGKGNGSGKADAWIVAAQQVPVSAAESVFIEQIVKAASAMRTASAFVRSAATAFDAEANNLDAVLRRMRGESVANLFG